MLAYKNLDFKISYNDGGRSKYFSELHKYGDCFVRAFALIENKDYLEVWKRYGYLVDKKGITNARLKKIMTDHNYTYVSGNINGKFIRLNDLPKNIDILVKVSSHVFAIKENCILDIFDYFENKNKCIYSYYIKKDK